MESTSQFYINSWAIAIKEEKLITFQEVYTGGVFLVEKLTTDTTKVVTKETLSKAVETVKISIMIEGKISKTV